MIEKTPKNENPEKDPGVEVIRSRIGEGKIREARLLAEIRLRNIEQALRDIEDALTKNEGEKSREEWETERLALTQEAEELDAILSQLEE